MTTHRVVTSTAIAICLAGSAPHACAEVPAREKEVATISGKKITIEYARPQAKAGKVFGDAVPFGQVWHPGAARLSTEATLKFGDCSVAPGTYSLLVVPDGSKPWELIVAKEAGSAAYDKTLDVCRMKMEKGSSGTKEPWQKLTIIIIRIPMQPFDLGFSLLRVAWGEGEAEAMFSAN